MLLTDSKGREVEVDDIEGEIGEGAYICGAAYVDDDTDVPDSEIDWMNDAHQETLYEALYQDMVGRGDDMADAYKDGTYD